ncbi:MAG: hypothetical protein ACFFEA_09110, partial [Candidatus Thorarchaeota archaeon]
MGPRRVTINAVLSSCRELWFLNPCTFLRNQAFARDILQILPKIHEQIDIGVIALFGGGGNGSDSGEEGGGAGAFQIFANVLLPMMLMDRMMDFDFQGLMKDSLGSMA